MERIIDKVKKLLNLANHDSATDGERDNALRMAWSLIRKHNLDIEEVNAFTKTEKREDQYDLFYGRPWTKTVCRSVAKLFFCKYYVGKSRNKNELYHHFVGKESNAITSKLISMFLVASIRKEARRQTRLLGENTTWRRCFSTGAAETISKRVAELLTENSRGSGTSLVLVDVQESELSLNMDYLKKQGVELVEVKNRAQDISDWGAFVEGIGYGGKLPLNTQVDDEEPVLLK